MELLTLFSLLVKYNLPFINKVQCVSDIQTWFMEGGSVWQKFAQVLSQYEEVVGKDLANALGKMCFECPAHDDIYSARIIRDAFGDKYDTKTMKMIGSGTISQVYKVYCKSSNRFVAIKVMHPNVKREIRDACDAYNKIKSSNLFPKRLKTILSFFFNGLREQLLMNKEFKNGKLFKKSLHPTKNGNYLFVIPEMIEFSKKCLVMDYEESLLLAKIDLELLSKTQIKTIYNVCNAIKHVALSIAINGFLHGDLHGGNIGIQNLDSNMKIVIYDFGQSFDISNIDINTRIRIVKSFMFKNSYDFTVCIAPESCHKELLSKLTYEFDDDVRLLAKYAFINDLRFDKNMLNLITSWGKMKSTAEMLLLLCYKYNCEDTSVYFLENGIDKYIDKYLPYDEFQCLRKIT
jgi:predicted unusual protein kinase regulating ubiquinone biosynthesis (AarF/ABC1/UbiB family)